MTCVSTGTTALLIAAIAIYGATAIASRASQGAVTTTWDSVYSEA